MHNPTTTALAQLRAQSINYVINALSHTLAAQHRVHLRQAAYLLQVPYKNLTAARAIPALHKLASKTINKGP